MNVKLLYVTGVAAMVCLCGLLAQSSDQARRCKDPSGRLLYEVRGTRVHDPSGRLMGTVEAGVVRSPDGRIVARDGDAGVLYCQVH